MLFELKYNELIKISMCFLSSSVGFFGYPAAISCKMALKKK